MSRVHAWLARAKHLVRKRGPEQETVCLSEPDGGLPLQVHLDNPHGTTADDAAALLAVVLDCSVAAAQRVLNRAGGVAVMGRIGAHALTERTGIALPDAERLVAAMQLGHRGLVAQTAHRAPLHSPESVARWLYPRIAGLAHEELWMLSLDTHHRLLGACRISQGLGSYTSFVIPVILRRALEMGASYILLAHNHPSGDPTASEEDIAMTAHLYNAACAVRLTLSDHIVIGGRGFSSMRTARLLPERPTPAIEALCPQDDYSEPIDWIALME